MRTHVKGKENGNATAYDAPPAATKKQASGHNDGEHESTLPIVAIDCMSDHSGCRLVLLDDNHILQRARVWVQLWCSKQSTDSITAITYNIM